MRITLKRFLIFVVIFTLIILISIYTEKDHGILSLVFGFNQAMYIAETRLNSSVYAYKRHRFNQWLSDNLPIDRKIPDTRPNKCSSERYSKQLPETSVIITFHNEARSALLRTIKSILSRTPSSLLKEIILVDDNSANERDGSLLMSIPKVKVIRNTKREGLIRSRMIGVKAASSSVLTFIDSHCEVNVGWIEPLLTKIYQEPLAIVSPVIDIIRDNTFEYKPSSNNLIGGFGWNMQFIWDVLSPDEMKRQLADPIHPIRTPMIAGGIFTIRKKWFLELGQYDPDLEIWGAENFEISFKTWMCGGEIEILPCSRVGHIFRDRHPYNFPDGNTHTYIRNIRRVAEVWMDDYKQIFYRTRGGYGNDPQPRIEERRKIRHRLNCESFEWYLKNIYPELRIPKTEEQAIGEIKQAQKNVQYCLLNPKEKEVTAVKCTLKNPAMFGNEQLKSKRTLINEQWSMTKSGLIRNDKDDCLYAGKHNKHITLKECNNKDPNQHWKIMVKERLRHQMTSLCIERKSDSTLYLSHCNLSTQQNWEFTTKFFF